MRDRTRRDFLADVGRGMLLAGVGPALAAELQLSPAFAADDAKLSFGKLEPLVALMQQTPASKLLPVLVEKLKSGTDLGTLVSAAALANARTFGGQDYDGYHAFMALVPSYEMARELPEERKPLPIFKVLYRNTNRIQERGGGKTEVLHPIEPGELPADRAGGEVLQEATRKADFEAAERTFAALARGSESEAFNDLQYSVEDEVDVHRVVLAWRAWAVLDLTGKEYAHTVLRQSVRYCVDSEQNRIRNKRPVPAVRAVLPKLLDQYKLLGKSLGSRKTDDAWVEKMSQTIVNGSREQAAEAVAAALAEGMAPESIGEAMSLAATALVLRDPGRTPQQASAGKPAGSIHGASVGVHASDSANAWRNIARVSNARNTTASLIVGAFHTAGQAGQLKKDPYPLGEHLEKVKVKDADALLREAEDAIKNNDQLRVAALVQCYGQAGHAARPVFDLLLRYAISEDGALHAEKYYRTITEEFATTRPAFRWRHLVALARVTASEHGHPAPGYAEACQLLKV